MEAIMKYNLPEDRDDFEMATKVLDMTIALSEIKEIFRKRVKYGEFDEKTTAELDKMYDEFHEIISDRGLGEYV